MADPRQNNEQREHDFNTGVIIYLTTRKTDIFNQVLHLKRNLARVSNITLIELPAKFVVWSRQ